MTSRRTLLRAAACACGPPVLRAAAERPQYIFFHGRTPKLAPSAFDDLLGGIPRALERAGTDRLRTGAAFTYNILEQPTEQALRSLTALLGASEKTGVPVFVCLDGQNWWQSRSELWNWWDPAKPGYRPDNRNNVEWFGWSPEFAVKIGWRNWGRQIRVAPAPNLSSPAVLAEQEKAYRTLVPVIAQWQSSLPEGRRWLFGGLKVGWETSINVNAYYYADGNALTDKDPAADPQGHKAVYGWTFGTAPLGYAAVRTAGLKQRGDLTKEDIAEVVRLYLERWCRRAVELGIPRDLVFTHQGGTYAPWDQHLSFRPGINDWSVPGYSFYSHDPQECGSLDADLAAAGRREWGAVEWLRKSPDAKTWAERLERTLSFRACRLLSIYNLDNFTKAPGGLDAVRAVLEARAKA